MSAFSLGVEREKVRRMPWVVWIGWEEGELIRRWERRSPTRRGLRQGSESTSSKKVDIVPCEHKNVSLESDSRGPDPVTARETFGSEELTWTISL